MDRRTFVLLSGATSGILLDSRRWLQRRPPLVIGSAGRIMFTLDERQRWTLSYHGEGAPVPLVSEAELAVHIGDREVALHELEQVRVARASGPDRHTTVVSGTTAGMLVEVGFTDAGPGETASITVTLSPDRTLPMVHGIRYFTLPPENVLPGPGFLQALVNGYHSRSESFVTPIPQDDTRLTSHGALGLGRRTAGLALIFDAGEPGESVVTITRDAVEARSQWFPARPLRPVGDQATLRIAFDPAGDAMSALRLAFVPAAVDRDRFTVPAPAGWCSWHPLSDRVSEADILANLDFCVTRFDPRFLRYIQVDDGYQRSAGQWETNDQFPHGHRWLTDQIHARGFQAGLWIAPFAVSEGSGIPVQHPEWLLRSGGSPVTHGRNAAWGGTVYTLDPAHREVRGWLRDLARRVVDDWRYDYLKADCLWYATSGDAHAGGTTHAEAYRAGLAALRDGLGPDVLLLGSGAPLQQSVGAVGGMRIGTDVDASWTAIQGPARATAVRSFYQRGAWFNDPDRLVARAPLALDEARVWATVVALSGGATFLSDDLPRLPPERLALLQRALPVAPVQGRAVDLAPAEAALAPAIIADEIDPILLRGTWRFRIGDDPGYAAPGLDDSSWESIPVPSTWGANHPGYRGIAWYRTRFAPPIPSPERSAGRTGFPVVLELGRIDDTDDAFVNGVKIGRTEGRQAFRRYAIPEGILRWGADNTIAIRVLDSGGDGGFWSVRRDLPPAVWVAEGAPRWWTVALINWKDATDQMEVPLEELGITAARCAAYDVWADLPAPEVTGALRAPVEPHTARVFALRPLAPRPQVIGSTRHIVQGAIDIAEEAWDRATRTLRVRATNLDRRRYAVTIAVPAGLEPGACTATLSCSVTRLPSGHLLVDWPEGTQGHDLEWSLTFQAAPRG